MKKTPKILITLLSLAFLLAGCNTQGGEVNPPSGGDDSGQGGGGDQGGGGQQGGDTAETYYDGISESLTGSALTTALNSLNNSKRKKTIGYDNLRYKLPSVDRVPETPEGYFVGFYNNEIIKSDWDYGDTWNREHVWPKSLGGGYVDPDIHMVRPTSSKINSARGNKYYSTTEYDPGEYDVTYRGICARIIFYCAIADTRLKIIDADSGGSNQMGKLSDLLRWNLQYLPSTDANAKLSLRVEQYRNETIFSASDMQGNRNPFIDHPEYACRIWGGTNATTKQICGM